MKHCIYFLLLIPFLVKAQNGFETEIPVQSGDLQNTITAAYQASDKSFALLETSSYVSMTWGGGYVISDHHYLFTMSDTGNIKNYFLYSGNCPLFYNDHLYYIDYGYSTNLIKIDLKGDTVFSQYLDNTIYNLFNVLGLDYNFIILGSSYYDSQITSYFFQKADTNGNFLALQFIGNENSIFTNYTNLFSSPDSGVYLVKVNLDSNFIPNARSVQKYNSNLTMVFNKSIKTSGNIYKFNGDKNFYCLNQDSTGLVEIVKYDDQFNLIDSINFYSSYWWESFYRLDNKGYFFVSREKMGEVDSTGNEIWLKQLYPGDSSAFYTSTIIKTADSGFLVCGSNDSSQTLYWDPDVMVFLPISTAALVKTGNLTDVAVAELKAHEPWQVYPNPVSNQLTIKVNSPISAYTKIVITNMLGQVCSERDYNITGNSITVNVANLTKAVYFINLITDKEKWDGMFIKE